MAAPFAPDVPNPYAELNAEEPAADNVAFGAEDAARGVGRSVRPVALRAPSAAVPPRQAQGIGGPHKRRAVGRLRRMQCTCMDQGEWPPQLGGGPGRRLCIPSMGTCVGGRCGPCLQALLLRARPSRWLRSSRLPASRGLSASAPSGGLPGTRVVSRLRRGGGGA